MNITVEVYDVAQASAQATVHLSFKPTTDSTKTRQTHRHTYI